MTSADEKELRERAREIVMLVQPLKIPTNNTFLNKNFYNPCFSFPAKIKKHIADA